jgi:ankyrin repeat protein
LIVVGCIGPLVAQTPPPDQALFQAVQQAGATEVKRLLDLGANVNAVNEAGATPLMWAIPDLAKVRLLVEHGANVNAVSKNLGRTPLLIAAGYPNTVPVLELLLDKGADLRARDRSGENALRKAARFSDVSVVRFLHEQGMNVNEPSGGSPALTVATAAQGRHYAPTIEYLLDQGAKFEAQTSIAPVRFDSKFIERWITAGAGVNTVVSRFGRTPLIAAASSDEAGVDILQLLLDKGADPDAKDKDGESALDWAMHRQDSAKIALLRERGAKEGDTPRDRTYPKPSGISDPKVAVAKSIALLQSTSSSVYEQRGCISCHQQMLVETATAAVRAKGIPIREDLSARNLEQMLKVYRNQAEMAMQGETTGGHVLTYGYFTMAMAAAQHKPDAMTAGLVHAIASWQMPDGSWPALIERPPLEYSTFSHTALSIRALTLYAPDGRRAEIDEQVRRARSWLLAAKPASAEEHAMRILGLAWGKASPKEIEAATRPWIVLQNKDGGWSQLPHLASDAYATGMTLYALFQAGVSTKNGVYRKGIDFLLRTQYEDGSWFVKTRSFPTQPHFESGYPFGYNQWISTAGACWATLAIAAAI